MKTIKKEIDVIICELCGKELNPKIVPVEVREKDNSKLREENEKYYFHKECVDKLLIEEAKEITFHK